MNAVFKRELRSKVVVRESRNQHKRGVKLLMEYEVP